MLDKRKWIQIATEFLIDNLTVLLTIGYATYIIYRQQMGETALESDDLLTAILTVLTLLAISEVVERYRRLNTIENAVNRSLSFLESRFTDRPSAIAFFQQQPSLDHFIQGANQIDLCGVTLTSVVNKQFSNLRDRLQKGAKVRILIIDPDSLAPKMSAERSIDPEDTEYFQARLNTSLRDVTYLFKSWGDLKSSKERTMKVGNLSIRLLSYAPSFGILSFDANQDNGIIFVEMYPHKFGFRLQPAFDLTLKRDGHWYKYFNDQFDDMWNAAKPWQPQISS